MKISEMTNDQATETLIRLSEPIANLCDSEEIVQILEKVSEYRLLPRVQAFGKILPKLALYAMKDHKQDLYEIVAALQMVSPAKVGKMNFKETLNAIKDSYDEILRDFFIQSAPVKKTDANG